MEKYVFGIDLGTSSVKVLAMNQAGKIVSQASEKYALSQPLPGYSEQDPADWVQSTIHCIRQLLTTMAVPGSCIEGVSFSGQMHGLVLLDANNNVLRPAILWNDTRTTPQCQGIERTFGDHFTELTGNRPLEGFTLPKLLWVKEHESEIWQKSRTFLLPKDYLRLQFTGKLCTDYSDATGTVMVDIQQRCWSKEICQTVGIPIKMCPPLVEASDYVGNVTAAFAHLSGLSPATKVFAGGGDNACGALGAAVLEPKTVLSSIGTSGVILKYEGSKCPDYQGKLQLECHTLPKTYYSMGVTLSAGHSLDWFKDNFLPKISYEAMMKQAATRPVGANGLLFTPYIFGERAPYNDAGIRGSFIGVDGMQNQFDFVRSIMEGITFSFRDILKIYETADSEVEKVIAIGGGAKSAFWLQIQADIFNKPVLTLTNEQGPGFGACMLAAVGVGWFKNLHDCATVLVDFGQQYSPIRQNVERYQRLYEIYHAVYGQTQELSHKLLAFRQGE